GVRKNKRRKQQQMSKQCPLIKDFFFLWARSRQEHRCSHWPVFQSHHHCWSGPADLCHTSYGGTQPMTHDPLNQGGGWSHNGVMHAETASHHATSRICTPWMGCCVCFGRPSDSCAGVMWSPLLSRREQGLGS
ncbi:unnamed protein product, partial [Discosporangium mesarthrocarpum]